MSIQKLLLSVGALLLCSLPAAAQFGQVDGYVLGPDKKPVLGAVVAFDRTDTNGHAEATTNKKGYYQFPSLSAGDYSITVTVNGVFRAKRDYYHVSPGRQDATLGNSVLGLTFNLKPAEQVAAETAKEQAKEDSSGNSKEKEKAKAAAEAAKKELLDSFAAGKSALEAKKYDEAVTDLAKASELDPKQAAVWSALADAYMGVAHSQKTADAGPTFEKAFAAFNTAIELAPTNAGNYNNFALALAANNRMDDAKKNLAKAIELDPAGAGKYHYNLGAFLMNASQTDPAMEEFKKGIEADPNYAENYFYLGTMLAGKSTTDASGKMTPPPGTIDDLKKYLQLKPNGPNAEPAKELIAALGGK